MQKQIFLTLIILSVTASLYAQKPRKTSTPSGADKTFELAPSEIGRRFWIDLGKGNKLRLELQDIDDMDLFLNVDSLLMVLINDMRPFADSMSDILASHRIDYVSDPSGRKKIRIQQFRPVAPAYLVDQGEPAALKLEQDSINIIIIAPPSAKAPRRHQGALHTSRLSIFVNQYHDLAGYITTGLNEKLRFLQTNMYGMWSSQKDGWQIVKDPSITAPSPKGYLYPGPGNDYLNSIIFCSLGNYKNYFVPSFGLGFSLHFNREENSHEIGVLWEPNFIFDHNAQGHLNTYRNDFIVVSYRNEKKGYNFMHELLHVNPEVSLGYLISRKGDYFDKNTFRLGLGGLRFYDGAFLVEPCLYFNNFFKQTTPGVRMSIAF